MRSKMTTKYTNKKIITIIIIAIIAIGATVYVLSSNQNNGKNGESSNQDKAKIEKWYLKDGTQNVGPEREALIGIAHKDWTQKNTTLTAGEDVSWSGEIRWEGSKNENLASYDESNIGIHLIISQNQKTNELHCILYLGKYSKTMGIPQGVVGEYIGHDSKKIQELGGENVSQKQSITANLNVSYQPKDSN